MRLSRKIGINFLFAAISIENLMFLNVKIVGLDIVDIIAIFGFIFIFYSERNEDFFSIKISRYTLIMLLFCVFSTVISIIMGYSLRYILPDVRNFLFLVFTFNIFRSCETDLEYVFEIVPFYGIVNSLIFLGTSSFFTGSYSREIYTPLWTSLLTIACVLFNDKKRSNLFSYIIAFICAITVVISETRSYIIPLLIMLAIYMIFAASRRQYLRTVIIVILIVFGINYLQNGGFYETLVNRMSGSLDSDSTLWLRIENGIEMVKGMDIFDWIKGRGFGERFMVSAYDGSYYETSDLEMFFFNQLTEWGLIVFLYHYYNVFKEIKHNSIRNKPTWLLAGGISISIGGFISGFSGMIGSVFLAMLLGMFAHEDSIFGETRNEVDSFEADVEAE